MCGSLNSGKHSVVVEKLPPHTIKIEHNEDIIDDKHNRLRDILMEYGEEFGDCIVDEISELFDYPNTNYKGDN